MAAHHLPQQTTPFVGRNTELTRIGTLLRDPACRLLTLCGPGGIGKTRLAVQAAGDQLANYQHGVYFVALAPVGSPERIPDAIASALQFTFRSSEAARIQITRYLREKQLLLVIDNFEHLLQGVNVLTDILRVTAGVKLLVTSRERLNVQEEWALVLEGLQLPPERATEPLESYSAVQLFIQRARQTRVDFSLEENEEAVKTICRRVEGMPLGLELAATWLRALSCSQIAARLENSLDLLTTPLRDVPERHRSLRAVFEQSWSMLTEAERAVLMRLSIFRGGFDVEAAEQVAGASLYLLADLTDKSLIQLNADGRYDLHELLRQYAAQKLTADQTSATTDRHLAYFLKLAEQAEAYEFGREQVAWFDRLEVELDNLRAALTWSAENETGLRLAAALGWFFSERAHWNEGLAWLERMLAANPDTRDSLRAKAFHSAGALAAHQGDQLRARAYCEQALALARAASDRWNIAWSLCQGALNLGLELNQSGALLEESLALFRELDDRMGVSHTLIRRASCAIMLADYPYARLLLEEAAIHANEAGDKIIKAWATHSLGQVCWFQDDDLKQAKTHFESSLALFREVRFGHHNSLVFLADVERAMGNVLRAQRLYEEVLILDRESACLNDLHVPYILAGLASIASARGQFERAAKLLAAAGNSSHLIRFANLGTFKNITFYNDVAMVRAQLGETALAEAWIAGKAMPLEQGIIYALEGRTTPMDMNSIEHAASSETASPASQPLPESLNARELEVLSFIASGLSNREIAAKMFLSVNTVKWYLKGIFGKLQVANRAQAVIRAQALGLLSQE